MRTRTTAEAQDRLAVGYALDYLCGETMALPEGDSKEKPLRLIAEILERERVPYALIGGVAIQVHTEEPRLSTLRCPDTPMCRARPFLTLVSSTWAGTITAITGARPDRAR